MSEVVDITSLEWQRVRPDAADRVYGKTLLTDGVTVVLTRVLPGGRFSRHRDDYGHLFYFLRGQGAVWVGGRQFEARPGLAVRIAANEDHAYENVGAEEMMLISINVPATGPCQT